MNKTLKNCRYTDLWLNKPEEVVRKVAELTSCEVQNPRTHGLIIKDFYFDLVAPIENLVRFKTLISK